MRCDAPNAAEEDSIAELDFSKDSIIYVLQPEVSGRELWVDYGTTVNVQKDAMTELIWSGTTPDETYHSNKDNPPTVKVMCNDLEINDIVVQRNLKYKMDKLIITSSDDKNQSQIDVDDEINIHLNEYGIEITKLVSKKEFLKNPQSFLFEIEQNKNVIELIMPSEAFGEYDDRTLSCTMQVSGLYAGLDSIVTEATSWSWRYELDDSDEAIAVTYHNNPEISYTKVSAGKIDAQFKNKRMISNWLDDEQTVINKFAEN